MTDTAVHKPNMYKLLYGILLARAIYNWNWFVGGLLYKYEVLEDGKRRVRFGDDCPEYKGLCIEYQVNASGEIEDVPRLDYWHDFFRSNVDLSLNDHDVYMLKWFAERIEQEEAVTELDGKFILEPVTDHEPHFILVDVDSEGERV